MKIIPLRDNVYVIPIEDPERTASGLWVPDEAKQRVDHGVVKYKGPKVSDDIKVGDLVAFSGYTGTKVVVQGEGVIYVFPEFYIDLVLDPDSDAQILFSKEEIFQILQRSLALSMTRGYPEHILKFLYGDIETALDNHIVSGLEF